MYSGVLQLEESIVEDVMGTASLLQMYDVVNCCSQYLVGQLHSTNCIGIRQFAEVQSCSDLRDAAHEYLMDHFEDVVQCGEYLLLTFEVFFRYFFISAQIYGTYCDYLPHSGN